MTSGSGTGSGNALGGTEGTTGTGGAGVAAGPPSADVWAASWSTVAALSTLTVLAALVATTLDAAGRLLFVALAVVLAGFAAYDALVRPSLVADGTGLTVRSGLSTHRVSWPDVTRVEVVTTRRLLVLHALEIDAGDDLLLLTRRRLGANLGDVARRLDALRSGPTQTSPVS